MKVIITIVKMTVTTRVYEGKVISLKNIPLDDYTETREIAQDRDFSTNKNKFIEDMAIQVTNHNKAEEARVLDTKASTMTKLIINAIT